MVGDCSQRNSPHFRQGFHHLLASRVYVVAEPDCDSGQCSPCLSCANTAARIIGGSMSPSRLGGFPPGTGWQLGHRDCRESMNLRQKFEPTPVIPGRLKERRPMSRVHRGRVPLPKDRRDRGILSFAMRGLQGSSLIFPKGASVWNHRIADCGLENTTTSAYSSEPGNTDVVCYSTDGIR